MAKRFKDTAAAAQPVYSTIIGAAQEAPQEEPMQEPQVTYQPQEAKEAQEALRTQGRKGVKALRINMAFTPSNTDYIRVMAAIRGVTMTRFVNDVLARELERNGDAYRAAKTIVDSMER